ncbi:hypothetical protein GCM10022222_00630 [Amycolatopsis ultiminotia]|uniref:CHAD domain-containing protein n=1 Tax=Amycolatopsis ultiminotia TaxID=543629 RepID=A0ABP6UXE8_9PSEU
MLRPTTGELLRAVHIQLAGQVLPALADGAPRRQLKSALHLLRRLERSWDLQATYLEADNLDLAETLDRALRALPAEAGTGYARLRTRFDRVRNRLPEREIAGSAAEAGVHDPGLAHLMTVNHALQEILADLQAALRHDRDLPSTALSPVTSMVSGLHRRLVARAGEAAGTHDDN